MSQYYGDSQWLGAGGAGGQPGWDHQTPPPPPARSGASSAIPREEPTAFSQQIEEVDRAIDNLVKSGKMFGGANGPRHGRGASGPGPQFGGDARSGGPSGGPGLQNFYASQRHQSSRGSNEAEQMMQAKRRMAAQRERELRNYHQEQQYNRTVLADMNYPSKPERALSPGSMSEDDRRDLIARQRSALYGENGGLADETGSARPGASGLSTGPSSHRGPSPLAYEYPRGAPEGAAAGIDQGSRNASPQSNPPNSRGPFDAAVHASRTSNSSPGGSPPRQGAPGQPGSTVAPIGTRPSISGPSQASNPVLNKRSTTPLPSPLSHGFSASGNSDSIQAVAGGSSNPSSAAPDGYNGWGGRSGVWGKQSSGLGVQASVWG
ncbi:hypothetical protein JX265_012490 [Neoarthrinium moseri]|uniref:Uncharacterized protein n=1 Tax=Neoarthrinium moseri TaxID=1658444 RepID=A0A9Q0AIJ6_9PEZI|nr:uncharacterized protein JN550_003176 [Neoarthrinium moseri]KAI1854321.1 hypothetical protein JX265_012490 [Neoarthrinium moseri]KAI1855408.1 hypothetical protein JX266_000273 [Neoarthrinium moseri]KAI1873907.1 hypothetical protein JN550_003176 [Neoarthrinium moseri]